MMVGAASAVVLEAAVTFLEIGSPGVVSWGQMLSLTVIGVGSYTIGSIFLIVRT